MFISIHFKRIFSIVISHKGSDARIFVIFFSFLIHWQSQTSLAIISSGIMSREILNNECWMSNFEVFHKIKILVFRGFRLPRRSYVIIITKAGVFRGPVFFIHGRHWKHGKNIWFIFVRSCQLRYRRTHLLSCLKEIFLPRTTRTSRNFLKWIFSCLSCFSW